LVATRFFRFLFVPSSARASAHASTNPGNDMGSPIASPKSAMPAPFTRSIIGLRTSQVVPRDVLKPPSNIATICGAYCPSPFSMRKI
jgi:hypothetical protein